MCKGCNCCQAESSKIPLYANCPEQQADKLDLRLAGENLAAKEIFLLGVSGNQIQSRVLDMHLSSDKNTTPNKS